MRAFASDTTCPLRQGVTMNRDTLIKIALRYDTVLSHAMLRALGVPIPKRAKPGHIVRVDKLNGLEECRKQRYGVRM